MVCLDQNYRSTANVVAASNAVIAPNGKGKADKQKKQLWTDKPPGELLSVTECRTAECEAAYLIDAVRQRRRQVGQGIFTRASKLNSDAFPWVGLTANVKS